MSLPLSPVTWVTEGGCHLGIRLSKIRHFKGCVGDNHTETSKNVSMSDTHITLPEKILTYDKKQKRSYYKMTFDMQCVSTAPCGN